MSRSPSNPCGFALLLTSGALLLQPLVPWSSAATLAGRSSAGSPRVVQTPPDDGNWSPIQGSDATPAARYNYSTAYDALGDRMIIFGGQGFGDTWQLSFAGSPN